MYKRIFFFNTNFNSNKQVSMLVTIESENFFFEKKTLEQSIYNIKIKISIK